MGISIHTIKVSTKGRVILPKAVRDQKRWLPGMKLEVIATAAGVLLTPARVFPPTRHEDVFGMLSYKGSPKAIEEMDAAVLREARKRNDRDRY